MAISQVTARTEPAVSAFDMYKDYLAGVRTPGPRKAGRKPTNILRFLCWQFRAVALSWTHRTVPSRALSKIALRMRAHFTRYPLTRRMQLSRTSITISKYKSERPGLSARTNSGYYNQPVYYDQPRVPTKRVTVHELQRILDAADQEHDGDLAKQLTGLELRERLSSSQLSLWKDRLHGKKSRAALVGLADESAFLDLPQAEILSDPAPDLNMQRQILSRTEKYLQEAIPETAGFFRNAYNGRV